MNIFRMQLTGLALISAAALALLFAPIHARADTGATDRHEVPTFVLERIELATGADASLG